MGNSLANLLVHVVFSTKDRAALLDDTIRPRLYAYVGGGLRELDCPSLIVGGTADHLHVLCQLGKTVALSQLMMEIKTSSSKWLHGQGAVYAAFHWQTGYGAFSVSQSNAEAVRAYIERQEEHHRTRSFQDELRAFLRKHGLACDERYVWE